MAGDRSRARLDALARPDKWYLSCGDGTLWAPPFPRWLHRPGLWDEAHVYYHPFAPLFAVVLADATGREIPLRRDAVRWTPDGLTIAWTAAPATGGPQPGRADPLRLEERRLAQPGGRFASIWRVVEPASGWAAPPLRGAWLVAFSAQPGEAVGAAEETRQGVRWSRTVRDRRDVPLEVTAHLTVRPADRRGDGGARPRVAARRSEASAPHPEWAFTPFPEDWIDGEGFRAGVTLRGISDAGAVYLAVGVPVADGGGDGGGGGGAIEVAIQLLPEGRHGAPAGDDPAAPWRAFLESFPEFACSDPHLSRYFDYRIYGLRLNRLDGGTGNVRYPAIAEGIGYFHVPISYSAQCHMWETRWRRDPDIARGSLRNFLATQKPDGSFHGRIYTNHLVGTDFYHANWGDAVLAVDAVHPDEAFLREAYAGLSRYADWLDRTRDREGSGMFDVIDQFETGQEYMSRYQAVDPEADIHGWENRIRLKGIDVTVYAYQLARALSVMARRLGIARDVARWDAFAERIGRALVEGMWDDAAGIFTDVDPGTMRRTGVKAAVSFYPLLTDLLTDAHVARLLEHLRNPAEFATPFPVPSSSADDPNFDANAEWKGKRHVCPWNGRVWPMTNSHIVEGLLRQWHRGRREVGPYAAELLRSFVTMMFHDGDLSRPNCFEHYNPRTGRASVYRGIDDYQHSWVLDLLVRGVAGLEPLPGHDAAGPPRLVVDPLPLELDEVNLTGAVVRGREVAVRRRGATVEADVDGVTHRGEVGTRLEIPG